jgi:hypothetical protein
MVTIDAAHVASMIARIGREIPFLRLGIENDAPMIAVRARGETIEDPECEDVYEALESGVFKRCVMTSGDVTSWRWLRFCGRDQDSIEAVLDRLADVELDERALDAIAFSLASTATLTSTRRPRGPSS